MTAVPKRRWFRYSLRTLFVVMTVLAMGLGWATWNIHRVRQREALFDSLASRYAIHAWGDRFRLVEPDPPPRQLPLGWRLFGAKKLGYLTLADGLYTYDDLERLATLYPETEVYHATWEEVRDGKDHPVDSSAQ